MGAALYEYYDFRIMCDVTAAIIVGFAILYFFVCNGCEAFSTTCKNYSGRNRRLSKVEKLTEKALDIRHSHLYRKSVVTNTRVSALRDLTMIMSA